MLPLAVAALFFAQTPQEQPTTMGALRRAADLGSKGRPLAQSAVLQRAFDHGTKTERKLIAWSLSVCLGTIGEEAGAKKAFEASAKPTDPIAADIAAEMDGAKREDAIAAIAKLARGRQIVMINEAHHLQRHRAFSLLLAKALRPLGFNYFAAEAFGPDAPTLLKNGIPTPEAGDFLRDPFFADLARQSVKMGYRPVAYEIETAPEGTDIYAVVNSRDQKEAENLVARVLKSDPKAKILIHCGFSHVTKTWDRLKDGRELAWLAARLQKLTGIEPLTIDQVGGTDGSDLEISLPEYKYAATKGWLRRSTAFRLPSGNYGAYGPWRGKVDVQVFHPPTSLVDGRAAWSAMNGYRRRVQTDPSLIPSKGAVLLQAFADGEPEGAIAMDQVVLHAGVQAPALMLPKGRYRIATQDENGVTRQIKIIRV